MYSRIALCLLAAASLPALGVAQSSAPIADAFRHAASQMGRNLVASADEMPADKYGYRPTPAQMSFGQVIVHIAHDSDEGCASIGGVKAPERAAVAATDGKDKLVARLRETFTFCDQALDHLTDAGLGDEVSAFGRKWTRGAMILETAGDWADHYSQFAIYLRLNGLLPPTAKKRA